MDFPLFALLIAGLVFGPYVVSAFLGRRLARVEAAAGDAARQLGTVEAMSRAQAEEIASLRREILALRGITPDDAAYDAARPGEAAADATAEAPAEEAPDRPAASGAGLGTRVAGWMRGGGLERQFGAVLPVWIGGIALAFAGFFLVRYSIENDLVGPQMRVILGAALGAALIGAARWILARESFANGPRIAQSLAGAGIAVLYLSAYAATALYALIPPFAGFLGMAAVTAMAVILSLRHGPAIALLGLVGGFLTPALIRSDEPSAMVLFAYLFLVFAALMTVVRRQGWWLLALPALALAFFWVLAWIFSDAFRPEETLWAGLFLAGVAGVIVAATRERYGSEMAQMQGWRDALSLRNRAVFLNIAALAGAFALMAVLAFNAQFGLHDWALFALLAVAAVALAFFDPRLYGFAPWAAMAVNAVMLAGWSPGTPQAIAIAMTAFGALYVLSGLLLFRAAAFPLLWAGLSVTAALGYYLLAYFRLDHLIGTVTPPVVAPDIDTPPATQPVEPLAEGVRQAWEALPHVWGLTAMTLAILFFIAALRTARSFAPGAVKERVLATFALATTAFIALALSVELQSEFLPIAIAAELAAVAWVASRTQIASLRGIAGLLGLAFAFLLLPQILLLIQLAFWSVLNWRLDLQESIPIVDYPLLQLALPAVFFLLAANLLRQERDGRLVRVLEACAVALIGLWGHYAASKLFHPGENVLYAEAGFLERGVITNILFLYGLACLVAGRFFGRSAIAACGGVLAAIALFRIVYFDLVLKNPVWLHDAVPGTALANALAVTFGLPMVWTWIAARQMAASGSARMQRLARWMPALIIVFAFAWLSFEVRRLYQGPFLDGTAMTDAELYAYSVAWLLFGLGLLFFGTLWRNEILRFASLGVMLATVSKVFLVDAASLTGLFRVFSFLGLGLSLIGLSYFYSRFVFGGRADAAPPGETQPSQ